MLSSDETAVLVCPVVWRHNSNKTALHNVTHFVTLWPWLVDLILVGGLDIMIDYPCAKFGSFSFSRFGFIVRTDRQTESQRQMIVILTHLPSPSVTKVSWCLQCSWVHLCYMFLVGWLSGRTSVSDWQTFTGLHRTCSWWVTIYMGKPSAVGQPTRPTQPFILTGSINE